MNDRLPFYLSCVIVVQAVIIFGLALRVRYWYRLHRDLALRWELALRGAFRSFKDL